MLAFPVVEIVTNSIVFIVAGACPPALIPLVELAQVPISLLLLVRVPKLVEFPVDAIVMKSILLIISPPKNIPLVEFEQAESSRSCC